MSPRSPRRSTPGVPPEGDLQIRHVQPYEATKAYRCPGCDHEIPPGTGHKVVVPLAAPELRRHWHTGCWNRASRKTGGGGEECR